MTYDEITLFRKFLIDKGTLNNFEYFYANHRFKAISIDAYYEKVEPEDAILEAFDMGAAGNTIFNFQYWKKLDERWQRKLEEYRQKGKICVGESLVYCLHCNRMMPKSSFAYTTKGVLHKHCKECESGEWDRKRREEEKAAKEMEEKEKEAKMLEKEIADKQYSLLVKQSALEKTTKVCDHCGKRKLRSEFYPSETSADGLQGWCKRCQDEHQQSSEKADAEQETQKPTTNQTGKKMEDFTFFDFEKKGLTYSIAPHTFAINRKKGNYTVVMSKADSKPIIEHDLLRLRLRQDNITGALHFVFNATIGAKCVVKNKNNVTVASRELVEFLSSALGYAMTDERIIADISDNLSNSKEYVTFLIKRPKK